MQPLGLRLGAGGERGHRLLRLAGAVRPARRKRRSPTPARTVVTPLPPSSPRRAEPTLRSGGTARAPGSAFAAGAVPNAALRREVVPDRGASWAEIEEFALTYDGYAYWSDVAELANRGLQGFTRDRTLPSDLDELRGCLFSEQRRWHHFGEEPHGRAAEYVWALLDAIRARLDGSAAAPKAAAAAPKADAVAAVPAPPSLPTPPVLPPPPAATGRTAAGATVASFVDDDRSYREWTDAHPSGFVLNAARNASTKGLKLHKATCSSVLAVSGTGRSLTSSYRKVCAADVDALLAWCAAAFATEPDPCLRCRP